MILELIFFLSKNDIMKADAEWAEGNEFDLCLIGDLSTLGSVTNGLFLLDKCLIVYIIDW